jgi:ABC-type multidrug transport system ATPase subunit
MVSVSLSNLTKKYDKGKVIAVDNVSLSVNKGELFGLIGPDGAGKTSVFRILTTLLLPDEGTAIVEGNDVVKNYKTVRGNVGYMPGGFLFTRI